MYDTDRSPETNGSDKSDDRELTDVLIAISVVARCLARNLERHVQDGQKK